MDQLAEIEPKLPILSKQTPAFRRSCRVRRAQTLPLSDVDLIPQGAKPALSKKSSPKLPGVVKPPPSSESTRRSVKRRSSDCDGERCDEMAQPGAKRQETQLICSFAATAIQHLRDRAGVIYSVAGFLPLPG